MSDTVGNIIRNLRSTLPTGVELVAVSKFQPAEAIMEAYEAGQRVFGESRSVELKQKKGSLPADIRWHFIGHLQTNKVKEVVGRADMIESVDSQRLLELIDKESAARGLVSKVLMQVHVAAESTKFGWLPDELLEFFQKGEYRKYANVAFCGLMGMATNTDDADRIESDFETIAALRRRILAAAPDLADFDMLSMGMSDDYPLAIKHGATLVRIGSRIFGEREYPHP